MSLCCLNISESAEAAVPGVSRAHFTTEDGLEISDMCFLQSKVSTVRFQFGQSSFAAAAAAVVTAAAAAAQGHTRIARDSPGE